MNTALRIPDLPLDPPDDSVERDAFEKETVQAFNEYLADGWLPGGYDPSHVDERLLEELPEALDGLIKAKNDAELLALAKLIRDKRIEIIDGLITDKLEAA